ncbi:DNA primase [uncultured Caudovirales phage]|uniref:DNA primase n=1 Tax=uncultured Caudovirales phage TaxID=2100421 RepID=A0A6J5KPP7_9CAUD|nr:DNA primase [uncultured Caudovirales phage]
MSVYLDRKFLLLVSSRLQRFSQKKDDLFNFRCPFCGDSQKNKLKARGYIFRKNNDYYYTCHNCNIGTTFSKFLKHIDADTHRQYSVERYTSGDNGHSNYKKPEFNLEGPKPKQTLSNRNKFNGTKLKSVKDLPADHIASKYVISRKIPEKFWNEIFYTENYKKFLDETFPDHGKDFIPDDERIVLFYTNVDGDITNISGRALGESKIRYCTVKITDEKKIFGMHRLSLKDKVYVLEGQFDSFFVPNSVASGDSNLCGMGTSFPDAEVVLVYDNEPRNKDIVKQIHKAVVNNYNVVLFPDTIPYKDINDMVVGGMKMNDILSIIKENTFQGLTAQLKFIDWKKC